MNKLKVNVAYDSNSIIGDLNSLLVTNFEENYEELYDHFVKYIEHKGLFKFKDNLLQIFKSQEVLTDIIRNILRCIGSQIKDGSEEVTISDSEFFNFLLNIVLFEIPQNDNEEKLSKIMDILNGGCPNEIFLKFLHKIPVESHIFYILFSQSIFFTKNSFSDDQMNVLFEVSQIIEKEIKNVYEEVKLLPFYIESLYRGLNIEIMPDEGYRIILTKNFMRIFSYEDIKQILEILNGKNPRKTIHDFVFSVTINNYLSFFNNYTDHLLVEYDRENEEHFKVWLRLLLDIEMTDEATIQDVFDNVDYLKSLKERYVDYVKNDEGRQKRIELLLTIKEILVSNAVQNEKSKLVVHDDVPLKEEKTETLIPDGENDNVDEKPNDGENLPDSETLENSSDDGISGSLVGDSNE
ncbi:MAG: hypothetical protein LBJ09_01170, partial [Clostridiales bacterium]|nr:hypothetical protein [Clostridiales bacterium]